MTYITWTPTTMYARNHAFCDDNRWTIWVISFSAVGTCLFYFLWNIFSSILFRTSPTGFVLFETMNLIDSRHTHTRTEFQWYGNLFCSQLFCCIVVADGILLLLCMSLCQCKHAICLRRNFFCQNFTSVISNSISFLFLFAIKIVCICGFTFIADLWQPTSSLRQSQQWKAKTSKEEEINNQTRPQYIHVLLSLNHRLFSINSTFYPHIIFGERMEVIFFLHNIINIINVDIDRTMINGCVNGKRKLDVLFEQMNIHGEIDVCVRLWKNC